MGGCTNCKGKSGCDDRKGDMLSVVGDVLDRVYPGRTWGEPDDAALIDGGVTADEATALAEELAAELRAAAFYVPGGPDELCDYVWLLAMGRTPCLLQARDFGVALPGDEPLHELYLRVALSSVARVAAVQQVAMIGERVPGGWLVREETRGGVYDAPLLKRFQRLVATLPAYDLVHVDMGEINAPPPGFAAGAWPFEGEPAVWSYLFAPGPASTITTSFLPDPEVETACSTTR